VCFVEDRYIGTVRTRLETQCHNKMCWKRVKIKFYLTYNINIIINIKYIIIMYISLCPSSCVHCYITFYKGVFTIKNKTKL
jgi:uncharacterized protein (UPF0305 family)